MWCLLLYLLWIFIFAFAVFINFSITQNFRLRLTGAIVIKEGILKTIVVGNFTNLLVSLVFGFTVLTICLDLVINFNVFYFFYAILNSTLVVIFYNFIRERIERLIVKEASDYYLFSLIPFLVTIFTVTIYAVLSYNFLRVSDVVPESDVSKYLKDLIDSHLSNSCYLWGSMVVFYKYVNYIIWVFIINLSQYKPAFLIALCVLLVKNGFSVWLISRLVLGVYLLKWGDSTYNY